MKSIKSLTTVLIGLFIFCQSYSQQKCYDPSSSILTAYYTYTPNSKFAVGLEAGKLNDISPLGIFGGVTFQSMNEKFMKQDSTNTDQFISNVYFKGTYRISRIENVLSAFVVASAHYSVQSGFDLQPGFRFIVPVSSRVGLGMEPLYSIKQNTYMLNFQVSVCVR
jgi:hypothetical protein